MLEEDFVATETWRVTPDMMCILDRRGCFVAVNPAWQTTLGWDRDEMVGEAYLGFLHPGDVERSMAAFEVVKTGEPVLRFENRYRTKDGGYRWFSWVAVPEGELFYCTVRDVTDDKSRDKTINDQRETVEIQEQTIHDQREEAKLRELFLAILGHDLRSPLGAVLSGIRILGRNEQSEQMRSVLRQMQESSFRMSELITSMMDFARVRLGDGIGLERQASPELGEKISELVREVEAAFADARIELELDLDETVHCDTARIMQVLSNLLVNAITHGEAGEPVRVQVRSANGRLRLAVSNRGEPIPVQQRGTLFQPFVQDGHDTSRHGLGLGLYICSQIAVAHGGELTVTSDDDETSFVLAVPSAPPPA